nr:6-phosphogluconolactonase [Spiroplasma clarkii]
MGLATGSSPESTYQYVIEKTAAEKIDWKEVVTFNLDEYIGLSETDEQSYCYYMNKKLFENININIKNTFVPSGLVKMT